MGAVLAMSLQEDAGLMQPDELQETLLCSSAVTRCYSKCCRHPASNSIVWCCEHVMVLYEVYWGFWICRCSGGSSWE